MINHFYNLKIEKDPYEKIVDLEFRGNIDVAINCMKKDSNLSLSEKQNLQLKCCLLFLYGMSLPKISQQLKIDKMIVLEYLNDQSLESLLSFEYCALFRLNQNRLRLEEKDPQTYHEENLKMQIEQLVPQNVVQKRYVKLCRAILIENIFDLKKLEDYTKMSKTNIQLYFNDPTKNEGFLSQELLEELLQTVMNTFPRLIKAKKKILGDSSFHEESNLRAQKKEEIVKLYQSGRYSLFELSLLTGTRADKTLRHMKLGKNERLKLEQHKKELKSLLLQSPRKKTKMVVKNPEMIQILKPDIKIIEPSDYKLLNIALKYLKIFEEIKQKDPEFPLVDMETVLILQQTKLKELLKSSVFLKLWHCLKIEQLLYGNEIKKKKEYIISVVKLFFVHDLDLKQTANFLEIPVQILIRTLQHHSIKTQYGVIVYEYLKKAITNYRLESEKEIGHSYFLS